VVTALYRRYRPETFAELIGQSQVTDPLRTALRNDRVNHAYLFSGPRGCGKTTSARILARCLNCAEGPTDTPCGVCPSCVELSRDGGGSMDVVEIDAASHNGVDDARDLRERAVFAPARDRYKIFILDEAHMVTPQGFNALLKIVEEPPEHVKFIFATTEPEKVIGTIRSRTHHYPFRLVPPAQMLEYVQQLSDSEKVAVEPGVLPLVVRAGGGSVRDTLSLLDQLIAGSEGSSVLYERAVALLGYTHGALLSEVVDAIGARDAAAAFAAVDRVIQTGQDPRRFVEDLLERLRDLIVVSAFSAGSTSDGVAAVLRGIQQDELDRMSVQAARFGTAELSRAADVANAALTEMTGATSPRLHLELMIARVLIPSSDDSERGALARVERLERRIGVQQVDAPAAAPRPPVAPPRVASAAPAAAAPAAAAPAPVDRPVPAAQPVAPEQPTAAQTPAAQTPAAQPPAAQPVAVQPTAQPAPAAEPTAAQSTAAQPPTAQPASDEQPAREQPEQPAPEQPVVAPVTLQHVKDSWPEILEVLQKGKLTAWMVVYTAKPLELRPDGVLVLSFPSQNDVDALKQRTAPGEGIADHLKQAIFDVLGIRVKFIAKVESERALAPALEAPEPTEPDIEPDIEPASGTTWATAVITDSEPETKPAPNSPKTSSPKTSSPKTSSPKTSPQITSLQNTEKRPVVATADGKQRYGESVVREILGASFIEEQAVVPRVAPREQ
jgi:DNA polymerase-3 subunit gamma/tau